MIKGQMKIDNRYQNPDEIIDCEFSTLAFFRREFFKYEKLLELAKDADNYYGAKSGNFKNRVSMEFDFESAIDIKIDGKDGVAHLGALIEIKNKNKIKRITHCVAIRKKEETKLLRKYHFDYEPFDEEQSGISNRQPHPMFHIQYAGKLTPKLHAMGIDDTNMDTWLSEPRLCYFPFSLALLINLILMEFPDENYRKLTEKSEWRKLVKDNENLILKPFFENCRDFFFHNDAGKLFINDYYYGN